MSAWTSGASLVRSLTVSEGGALCLSINSVFPRMAPLLLWQVLIWRHFYSLELRGQYHVPFEHLNFL